MGTEQKIEHHVISQGEENRDRPEKALPEIKAENFQNFVRHINLQIQEVKQILNVKKKPQRNPG